jgi:glycosyltransferase involved in cell wall biosynthesis
MKFRLLTRTDAGTNAIDQATACLAAALEHAGYEARVAAWRPGRLVGDAAGSDVLVVPYNPFMWARWGFAPRLLADVAAVRVRRDSPEVVLVVHEPYVPINDAKSLAMGAWQRFQLASLLLLSDRRFASIERWSAMLGRVRPTRHLPSGSNLPDCRGQRTAVRTELGIGDALAVATLSTGHPSHLTEYVEAALARLDAEGVEVVFLQLGAGSADLAVPAACRAVRPGLLSPERLGALLAGADLMLSPFADGVSTRRTSFVAGLCEAVAVVGTEGELTDRMLIEQGLELVPVGNAGGFAERVLAVATDPGRRAGAAASGRALFEAQLTWETIAARLLAELGR